MNSIRRLVSFLLISFLIALIIVIVYSVLTLRYNPNISFFSVLTGMILAKKYFLFK